MAVIIQCPHCQSALEIDQDPSGMELECPVCKKAFTVQKDPVAPDPAATAPAESVQQEFTVQKDPVAPDPAAPAPAEPVQPDNSGTFTFVCPSCRAAAELPVSLMGQKYECQMCFEEHVAQATPEKQCPYCGQTIKYHAMTCKYCGADLTKTPPRSESKTEKTFVFICPECKAVEFLPVAMKGQRHECKMCCETSVAQPAGERKCPHCGEKIKINAVVCCHCNKKVKPLIDPIQRRSRNIGRIALGLWVAAAVLTVLGLLLPVCFLRARAPEIRINLSCNCYFFLILAGLSLELFSSKRKNLIAGGIVFSLGAAMHMAIPLAQPMDPFARVSAWRWGSGIVWIYLCVIVFLFAWYRQKRNGQPDNMIPAASDRLDRAGRITLFLWLASLAAYLISSFLIFPFREFDFVYKKLCEWLSNDYVYTSKLIIFLSFTWCLSILLLLSSILLELLSPERKYRFAAETAFFTGRVSALFVLCEFLFLWLAVGESGWWLLLLYEILYKLPVLCFLAAAYLSALKKHYENGKITLMLMLTDEGIRIIDRQAPQCGKCGWLMRVALIFVVIFLLNGVTIGAYLGIPFCQICKAEKLMESRKAVDAVKWYRKAAEQGNSDAQYTLGEIYYRGKHDVTTDRYEGLRWYRKAAEQGHVQAQYSLGWVYRNAWGWKEVDRDDAEAFKWFRKAAEQGHVQAQYNLGDCYVTGKGVTKDYNEAVKWYRKAAERGDKEAQFALGDCHHNGQGVAKDLAEAVKWYCTAWYGETAVRVKEKSWHFRGEDLMVRGCRFYLGKGVTKDYAEAVKWFRKAAERENEDAQVMLGFCYSLGQGVTSDKAEAIKWFRKAAKKEYGEAGKKAREELRVLTK